MSVIIALTIGLIVLICGYSLGLGSLVSATCAAAILMVGVVIYAFGPGRPEGDEAPADPGRAIN